MRTTPLQNWFQYYVQMLRRMCWYPIKLLVLHHLIVTTSSPNFRHATSTLPMLIYHMSIYT